LQHQFSVTVRSQLQVDERNQDVKWLIDQSLGHWQLVRRVIDALHNFWPVDEDGNAVTVYPMKLKGGGKPRKDKLSANPQAGKSRGWGQSVLRFLAVYEEHVFQVEPALMPHVLPPTPPG
jgi:hypothetical protein